MTLILAIAVDNYIYLSADTRVTTKNINTEKIVSIDDDYLKMWWFSGVYCVVAGDAGLARLVINSPKIIELTKEGFDTLIKDIKAQLLIIAEEYWRVYRDGHFSEATIIIATMENEKPRIVEIVINPRNVTVEEKAKNTRYIYGALKKPLSEELEDIELHTLSSSQPGGAFTLNAARINALIGANQLASVGRYITSLRISADSQAIFPSGKIIPISLSKPENAVPYEVRWDGDLGWPYIIEYPHQNRRYLRPFSSDGTANSDLAMYV